MKAAANTLLTNENARILKHTIYEPSLLIFHGIWSDFENQIVKKLFFRQSKIIFKIRLNPPQVCQFLGELWGQQEILFKWSDLRLTFPFSIYISTKNINKHFHNHYLVLLIQISRGLGFIPNCTKCLKKCSLVRRAPLKC